jgi:putative ABC transport system substrate-binding protein
MRSCNSVAGVGGAQQPAETYHIAIVDSARKVADISESDPDWRPFFRELRLLGYVEGRNLIIDRRSGEGRPERYANLAQEVVALNPDVIVSSGSALAAQLKSATQTIPIVATVGNPVGSGLVASMARPGGNITGYSIDAGLGLYSKSLEILRSINPSMSKVALLGAADIRGRPVLVEGVEDHFRHRRPNNISPGGPSCIGVISSV